MRNFILLLFALFSIGNDATAQQKKTAIELIELDNLVGYYGQDKKFVVLFEQARIIKKFEHVWLVTYGYEFDAQHGESLGHVRSDDVIDTHGKLINRQTLVNAEGINILPGGADHFRYSGNAFIANRGRNFMLFDAKGKKLIDNTEGILTFAGGYAAYKQQGSWSFIHVSGKIVERNYSELRPLIHECGGYIVRAGNYYSFIDTLLQPVIVGEFTSMQWISYDHYVIEKAGKYGVINSRDKFLLPVEFERLNANQFLNEEIVIARRNGKDQLLSPWFKFIGRPYDHIKKSETGFYEVRENTSYGIIDSNGREIVAPEYEVCDMISEWGVRVKKGNYYGLISWQGKTILPLKYTTMGLPANERIVLGITDSLSGKSSFTYCDKTGELLSGFNYESARSFSEGLAAVRKNGKFGFIDTTGKLVVTYQFVEASSFKNGYCVVAKKAGKYGMIDITGLMIIPFKYEKLDDLSEDMIGFRKNGKWGFLNANGEQVIAPQYSEILSFSEGMAAVKDGPYWIYINKNKDLLIDMRIVRAESFSDGNAVIRIENSGRFLIDRNGHIIRELK